VDLVFVSKYFHVEYELVEKNLRRVIEHTLSCYSGQIVLLYGDLCLGPNGEMKEIADEYGIVKIDAVNCVDCLLGGKGKSLELDPQHNLMFMGPGMIEFFKHMKEELLKQGMDELSFANMFNGIRGFVLLETCGNSEKMKKELEATELGVPIIETWKIGLDNVWQVVFDAIQHASRAK